MRLSLPTREKSEYRDDQAWYHILMNTRKKEDSTFIWVKREHHKEIKIRAAEKGVMMTDLLDEVFESYFKKNPR